MTIEDDTKGRTDGIALSVVLLWGFSFAALKIALATVDPWSLTLLRFLPSALSLLFLLLAFPRHRGLLASLKARDLARLGLLGFVGICCYNLCLNLGQNLLPSQLTALVIALNPLSIALCAALWIHEGVSVRQGLGLVVALAGVLAVLLLRDLPAGEGGRMVLGIALTLGAPLSWGVFTTGLRKYTQRWGSFPVLALSTALGTLPLLALYRPNLGPVLAEAPSAFWLALAFLVLACTVYGFSAWSLVVRRMPAARAGAFIYLVPVVAAFAGRWLLEEPLDLPLLAGAALVLAGVRLATMRRRGPQSPS